MTSRVPRIMTDPRSAADHAHLGLVVVVAGCGCQVVQTGDLFVTVVP
jgi:hypothetical protein